MTPESFLRLQGVYDQTCSILLKVDILKLLTLSTNLQ